MPFVLVVILPLSLLVVVSAVHPPSTDDEVYYPIYLMRSITGAERYPYGSEQIFQETIRKALPQIGLSALKDGSCAVVFHGNMGSGKSSIIERLMGKPSGFISSGRNYLRGGETQTVTDHKMDIDHPNTLYLLDSPGFKDPTRAGKQFDAFASIANVLQSRKLPIFRLYLVLDIGTGNGTGFDDQLKVLLDTYGPEVARTTRLIVNKSDRLKRGKTFIRDTLIANLQASFRKLFDRNPIIIFTSARLSSMGCIGQLIDDLCSLRVGSDLISLDSSRTAVLESMAKADASSVKARLQPLSRSEYEEQASALLSEISELSFKDSVNQDKQSKAKDALEKKQALFGALCPSGSNAHDNAPAADRSIQFDVQSLDMLFFTVDLVQGSRVYRDNLQKKFHGRQMSAEELAEFWKAECPEGLNQSQLASDVAQLQSIISECENTGAKLKKKQDDLRLLKERRDNTVLFQ